MQEINIYKIIFHHFKKLANWKFIFERILFLWCILLWYFTLVKLSVCLTIIPKKSFFYQKSKIFYAPKVWNKLLPEQQLRLKLPLHKNPKNFFQQSKFHWVSSETRPQNHCHPEMICSPQTNAESWFSPVTCGSCITKLQQLCNANLQ